MESLLRTLFNLALAVIFGLIGWYVIGYFGHLIGIPAEIIKICGVLIFLCVVFQVFSIIKK